MTLANMKKTKKPFLDLVAESDSEFATLAREIKHDYAVGILRNEPRSYKGCQDWQDAWLYIFRRAYLGPDDHMRIEGKKVTHIVWIGRDFNDKMIDALEKITLRLGTNRDLAELRLVRTAVSNRGTQRLKAIIPDARITVYTKKDAEGKPWLSYADVKKAKEMFPNFPSSG